MQVVREMGGWLANSGRGGMGEQLSAHWRATNGTKLSNNIDRSIRIGTNGRTILVSYFHSLYRIIMNMAEVFFACLIYELESPQRPFRAVH